MTPVELFNKWAGDHEWSDWAKPTLFAQAASTLTGEYGARDALVAAAVKLVDESAARGVSPVSGTRRAAMIVDCPGEVAVAVGAVLSQRGFVPVPLFNGVYSRQSPLVENGSILSALDVLADRLRPAGTSQSPAFLLDSRRLEGKPSPGKYDNRWIVFPQDFPSGGRLVASGIRDCFILAAPQRVADDLCHVLKRWQDAGIEMHEVWGQRRQNTTIATPPWYRHVFYRVAALTGMRPTSYGAFGALIPIAAAGGGYG